MTIYVLTSVRMMVGVCNVTENAAEICSSLLRLNTNGRIISSGTHRVTKLGRQGGPERKVSPTSSCRGSPDEVPRGAADRTPALPVARFVRAADVALFVCVRTEAGVGALPSENAGGVRRTAAFGATRFERMLCRLFGGPSDGRRCRTRLSRSWD